MREPEELKEVLGVLAEEALTGKGGRIRKLLIELSVREWKQCPVLSEYYQNAKKYLKDCESGIFPWSERDIKTFAIDDIFDKLQNQSI